MIKPRQQIHDWYQADWRPAAGPNEMPTMSWRTIDEVVDRLAPNPARKAIGIALFRRLQLESASLSQMELLQQIILSAAAMMSTRARQPEHRIPVAVSDGLLPRWSYTDLEVVLTCSAAGDQRFLALERHHDLVQQWGMEPKPASVMRAIFLIAFGVSVRPSALTSTIPAPQNPIWTDEWRASA